MTSIQPVRRTPLGLAYAPDGDNDVDWSLAHGEGVHSIARDAHIRLLDLTRRDRFGLKGRGASAWFTAQGVELPARVNTAVLAPARGADVMRLGQEDIVFLSRPGEKPGAPSALRALWQADASGAKGFDSWRDEVWAWFHVYGDGVAELLAMTCPVDLRPDRFALGAIAQTRVAQLDCVVLRSDRAGAPGFDLFFDVASSAFVLESLVALGRG